MRELGAPGPAVAVERPLARLTIADALTLANALCGLLALGVLVGVGPGDPNHPAGRLGGENLHWIAAFVVAGALLDLIDGPVAQRVGSSGLGRQLDVGADAVTFGAVPAVLLAVHGADHGGAWEAVALAVGCGYLAGMLLRVSRFAVAPPAHGYSGITSPLSAFAAISLIALDPGPAIAVCGYLLLAGLALSQVHYPRPGKALAPLVAAWAVVGVSGILGALPIELAAGASLATVLAVPIADRLIARSCAGRELRPGC